MRKINFDFIPKRIRLWAPPLIGIPAMLALGLSVKELGFLLFGHHLFWMIGILLLINPVSETYWPSPTREKSKHHPGPPSRSSKVRRRAESRKRMTKAKPASTLETPAERLARLQKEKEAVDKELERLTPNPKSRTK